MVNGKTRWVLALAIACLALSAVITTADEPTCYCVSAPESVSPCVGETAVFSVTASGLGSLAYQWHQGGTPLSDGENVSGATTARLEIANVSESDEGEYTVTVSGTRGRVTSAPAILTVKEATVIVEHPISLSVCPGETADFSVVATGEGELTYQWYRDASPLRDDGRVSGSATPELTIAETTDADAGLYTVAVTGECGEVISTGAILTVKAPTAILSAPSNASVCPGTNAGFAVTATGEGTLTYQWHKDSSPLRDGGRVDGATTPELTIAEAVDADAGQYSVTVTGDCGQVVSAAALLSVKAPTAIAEPPSDISVCPGEDVSFAVNATGEGELSYQWYQASLPLEDDARISGTTTSELHIEDVSADDAGQYTVVITGECGQVTSPAATLIVRESTAVTTQPVDVSVYAGGEANFSIVATGEAPLSYQWFRGSTALVDDGRISGTTTPELRITDVVDGDAGRYSVTVSGGCGEAVSDTARLKVRQPMGYLEVLLENQPKDVLLILDLSSSMQETIGDGTKMEFAKDALEQLIQALPGETRVGLRTFRSCGRSELEVSIQPLSSRQLLSTVRGLETAGRTPLAYTLNQIPGDLAGLEGPHVVVFITDGTETCDEDPVAAARVLTDRSLDVIFRLIGLDINRVGGASAHDQLQAIADAGNGLYLPVDTGQELVDAILGLIVPPTYRVFDSAGDLVVEGVVGDDPIELRAGTYRVVVGDDATSEDVEVRLDKTTTLEVPRL